MAVDQPIPIHPRSHSAVVSSVQGGRPREGRGADGVAGRGTEYHQTIYLAHRPGLQARNRSLLQVCRSVYMQPASTDSVKKGDCQC